ncbi:amidase [Neobacillus citreus]|uniref:Amidase n=1 Tax=Neobacillus citreus TaxID=2833578 RepID=A0A942T3H0_9BACI|nr:amidase [Neobacillus citreus]MCH6264315.1 amidase [Neobacillus citreus]
MNFNEYSKFDATDLASLVKAGEVSPKELVQAAFEGIEKLNPVINAVVSVLPKESNQEIEAGLPDGPFTGVPFLIKESSAQAKGIPVQLGSRFGQGMSTLQDTNLMARFRRTGLVTVGTSTTPEFAFNFSTESVLYGPTRNPWNPNLSSGGSSGGACAAVAAGIVPIAHANDGAGSIRQPAAVNGLVGLKPTRGRIPNGPHRPEILNGLGNEFAVTRTVRDAAALLDSIGGADPGARNWVEKPAFLYLNEMKKRPKKLRIAWTDKPWNNAPVEEECKQALYKTVQLCEDLGHELVEASPVINAEQQLLATLRIWSANLGHSMEKIKAGLNRIPSTKNLEASNWAIYQYGQNMTAYELLEAFEINNSVSRTVGQFFTEYDLLLTPAIAQLPWPIGKLNANDPSLDAEQWIERMMAYSPFTNLFNTTGQPAISLPLGWSSKGLPIGMQFAARFGDEATLFQLAGQLEEAQPWKDRKPNLKQFQHKMVEG